MFAAIPSATLVGAAGIPVSVEVHVSNGLPSFTVVGLPDAGVRESRDRVRAAMLSSELPWCLRRITVNLAPSGVRKGGAGLDLPIAIGILVAMGEIPAAAIEGMAFTGELGLSGSLRHVPGAVALAGAPAAPLLVVPTADAAEAAAVRPGEVVGVDHLRALVAMLRGERPWPARRGAPPSPGPGGATGRGPDLADLRGQQVGRRVVEVAAAGRHHLLLVGPPGSGKTMLAVRLSGLLPDLPRWAALEVARIHSAANVALPPGVLVTRPPFRAPHHGASSASLIGGGSSAMRPGEISLAHHGVLFLDEMGEFPAAVLNTLRQPLEEGEVRISRAHATVTFPGRFLLVGAMNPCPCGEGGAPGRCRCNEPAKARYAARASAPLLDRFDLAVPLSRPDPSELAGGVPGEPSAAVARRVAAARRVATARGVAANADLPASELDRVAPLSADARTVLLHHVRTGSLSGRGFDRVRRVARTVADLEAVAAAGSRDDAADTGSPALEVPLVLEERHVAEALALRAGRSALVLAEAAR